VIRIGIVEDDAAYRDTLKGHLARYAQEHSLELDVRAFSDGSELVRGYRPQYDILFLDVEMPGMDGFEVAHRIRDVDTDVIIIFVTNMGQFAIRGFEVDALSYLVKPVTYFAFAQELARSLARLHQRAARAVVITARDTVLRLDPAEIVYVEAVRQRITIHGLSWQRTFSGTLKALEEQLADVGFFRSNNCYLVNLRHVISVEQGASVMVGGEALQVSRPRKKAFLEALAAHVDG